MDTKLGDITIGQPFHVDLMLLVILGGILGVIFFVGWLRK